MFSSYNSLNPTTPITMERGTGGFNDITIRKEGAPDLILNTNETTKIAEDMVGSIQTWVNTYLKPDDFLGTKKKGAKKIAAKKGTIKGGVTR